MPELLSESDDILQFGERLSSRLLGGAFGALGAVLLGAGSASVFGMLPRTGIAWLAIMIGVFFLLIGLAVALSVDELIIHRPSHTWTHRKGILKKTRTMTGSLDDLRQLAITRCVESGHDQRPGEAGDGFTRIRWAIHLEFASTAKETPGSYELGRWDSEEDAQRTAEDWAGRLGLSIVERAGDMEYARSDDASVSPSEESGAKPGGAPAWSIDAPPGSSRVRISKTEQTLHLTFEPLLRNNLEHIAVCLAIALAFVGIPTFWAVMFGGDILEAIFSDETSIGGVMFLLLVSLFFVALGLLFVFIAFVLTIDAMASWLGTTHVTISPNDVLFTRQIGRWDIYRGKSEPVEFRSIRKIFLSTEDRREKIILNTKSDEHALGTDLSHEEREWLAGLLRTQLAENGTR